MPFESKVAQLDFQMIDPYHRISLEHQGGGKVTSPASRGHAPHMCSIRACSRRQTGGASSPSSCACANSATRPWTTPSSRSLSAASLHHLFARVGREAVPSRRVRAVHRHGLPVLPWLAVHGRRRRALLRPLPFLQVKISFIINKNILRIILLTSWRRKPSALPKFSTYCISKILQYVLYTVVNKILGRA